MPVDNSDYLDPDGFSSPLSIQHDELEWREVTDSYDTIVCYIATADRPAPRQPHSSYRIFPEQDGTSFYSVELWHGTSGVERIGSVNAVWSERRGERTLEAAKRAAQNHYDNRD